MDDISGKTEGKDGNREQREGRKASAFPNISAASLNAGTNIGRVELKLPKLKDDYALTEAIKAARTNIEYSGEDNKVLAITSCVRDEGKSFVSVNLAMALAEGGKRVFYIDADMRKSVLLGRYRVKGKQEGLSSYLVGHCDIDNVMVTTNVRNLDIIFAGRKPPNPSELLGGKRFGNLVRKLREEYDYVIIDTPPIGEVIDAAVVAKNCDGTILVAAFGHDSYRFINNSRYQVEKSGCRVLGIILNKVPREKRYRYGSYYGRYYGGYDGYGNYGSGKKADEKKRNRKSGI
ncbi:MAG: CpsD/CapB family tyrosine-protein kinase [Lachnospiraceae bacterium]|nr:CpsD/CapB family tyrosine-protein kinase [Lachnospiraceae bacterium]